MRTRTHTEREFKALKEAYDVLMDPQVFAASNLIR